MNPRLKSTLQFVASILVMFGFLYFSFRGTDFARLWEILERANYWWVIMLLPPLLLSHAIRAWRWEYMMRPIKKNMRYRNLWSALMIGYMLNNILPKVGEVVRPYAIGKLEKVSRSSAFGTVIVERIFDIMSFMLFIALLPLVYRGPLNQTFPWLEEVSIWLSVLTLGSFAFFVVMMLRREMVIRILGYLTKRASPARAVRIEKIVHSFLDGFLFVKDTGSYVMIIVLTLVIWFLYVVMMWLPFYAFDMPAQYGLGLGAAQVVQTISSIGIVIPTPGATGPYHYFVIQTLTKLYGVDGEVAKSYAAATHAIAVIGTTLVGLYYFLRDKIHIGEAQGGTADAAVSTAGVTPEQG